MYRLRVLGCTESANVVRLQYAFEGKLTLIRILGLKQYDTQYTDGQVDNALLYGRVGHYNECVKFECNDRYHCTRKTILMICQPRIYFSLGGEKGDLCLNELNTLKLNYVQKINNFVRQFVILGVNLYFLLNKQHFADIYDLEEFLSILELQTLIKKKSCLCILIIFEILIRIYGLNFDFKISETFKNFNYIKKMTIYQLFNWFSFKIYHYIVQRFRKNLIIKKNVTNDFQVNKKNTVKN
ncbi:hypothetical protein AGLY_007205 [Aphis glycines]|uniref:Uncharacterized protein n=1 Tax=Aphis glycines TaxID=307491 RepID=A0A6G0TNX3_APHGL|nr:hypothetical protein AGLY_007205 [Aphis glycines]